MRVNCTCVKERLGEAFHAVIECVSLGSCLLLFLSVRTAARLQLVHVMERSGEVICAVLY